MASSQTACPICYNFFATDQLPQHVNDCLDLLQVKEFLSQQQEDHSYMNIEPQQVHKQTEEHQPQKLQLDVQDLNFQGENLDSAEEMERNDKGKQKLSDGVLGEDLIVFDGMEYVSSERRDQELENQRLFEEFLLAEKQREDALRAETEMQGLQTNCYICNKMFDYDNQIMLESCPHSFCRACIHAYTQQKIKDNLSEIPCPAPNCTANLVNYDLKAILTQGEYDEFIDGSLKTLLDNSDSYVKCPHCSLPIETIKLTSQQIQDISSQKITDKGLDGQPLSIETVIHRHQYRFRCRQCETEFCADCKASPYHYGFTCAQYQDYMTSKHCRYCEVKLTSKNITKNVPFELCKSVECVEKSKLACGKPQQCGHRCYGTKGEKHCSPCLHTECNKIGEDYCNICWTESLQCAPTLQIECGHTFHYKCLETKLNQKWPGARITFGFMNCPLCNQRIQHERIQDTLKPLNKLYEEISKKAMLRLDFEKLLTHEDITQPQGRFYQNPLGFAFHNFSYYPCFKCKKAYFGGMKRCEEQQQKEVFEPSELVCGACSSTEGSADCQTHGAEYIEFKCRYCCKVAIWFCFGTTHFCDECHQNWSVVTKKPLKELPQCTGGPNCPLGIRKHPANGEEYALGCGLCRHKTSEF